MKKSIKFDHNTNEHLEWVLKLAYKYSVGDLSVASEETSCALSDALCNLIGDDKFCDFVENDISL